ncbi:hypothetical protein GGI05_003030, partial [Coemansia sp. RSA 2603]
MPSAKVMEKVSQPVVRKVGMPSRAEDGDEKQLAGCMPPDVTQAKSVGVAEVQEAEEPQKSNDTRMVNMERQMDNMCILLERLMAMWTMDQYYMVTGGTLMPVSMA